MNIVCVAVYFLFIFDIFVNHAF